MLGFQTRCGGAPCGGFLFGTTTRFPRRLPFCRHARQGSGFGDLLGTKHLVRQIGGASFGFGPFAGQPCEFLLLLGASSGRTGQFGNSEFTALRIRQGALLRLDSRTQGDFCQAFEMCLLRGRDLCRRLGRGAAEGLLCGQIFGLPASLRGSNVLSGYQPARLGGGASPFFRSGAGQSIGRRRALGVCRVCGGKITICDQFPSLPLCVLQFLQQLAQTSTPKFRAGFQTPGCDRLPQTWHGPKVE